MESTHHDHSRVAVPDGNGALGGLSVGVKEPVKSARGSGALQRMNGPDASLSSPSLYSGARANPRASVSAQDETKTKKNAAGEEEGEATPPNQTPSATFH